MLKKLLKSINTFFSTKGDISKIENYLSKSSNLYDLELKIRDLLANFDSGIANIEPTYVNERPGDIKHSIADVSKANSLLNYAPQYDCKVGLNEAIEWYWNSISR